ncbi:hypothetical protein [Novosphingobium sp.]|uniref:hypothetical protein n=1 Tax=Novosphingobium sp. TaxID=1874826 RepID=UPI002732CFC9|nr:hypothetical protein [Novosphingobium sp.]MDP3905941.1 hypothetical protein [Novosphingobium sp.]
MNRLTRLVLPLTSALILAACGTSPAERLDTARQEIARQNYLAALEALIRVAPNDPAIAYVRRQLQAR